MGVAEENEMRQLIIARKDLNMSPGKLAAQVSHASMAFISRAITCNVKPVMKYSTVNVYGKELKSGEKIPKIFFQAELGELARQTRDAGRDSFTYRTHEVGGRTIYELCENEVEKYNCTFSLEKDVYEQWFAGIFTKTICEAKNRNQLMKAITMAEELELIQGEDFFLIKDNCLTELEPEEVDENGVGRVLTCIGFRPLPDEVAHQISRKYQLYR